MDRREFLRHGTGAAVFLTLAACDRQQTQLPHGPLTKKIGGSPPVGRQTLRLPGGDAGFPSPFAYRLGPGYSMMILIYDTLLLEDGNRKLVPWLASDYQRSADGLVYTFDLRENVRWHDGRPLSAEDVVFTFNYHAAQRAKGKLSPQLILQPANIVSVKAVAANKVEFRLGKPAVTFPTAVAAGVPIVPRHVWSGIEDASTAQDPKALIGTGPYRLDSYRPGLGEYSYNANDDFFLGKPLVKRLQMVHVDNVLNALLAGEIDAGSPNSRGFSGATGAALRRFQNDRRFGIIEGSADNSIVALYFSLAKGGALADRRFRQACARAIDRPELVRRVLSGRGQPGNPGLLPRSHPYYAQVEQYRPSRSAARRLLEDAGYKTTGNGRVRSGPEGKPLRFPILATAFNAPVVELIVGDLKEVGVLLEIEPVENFIPFVAIPKGDFETAVIVFGGQGGDPDFMRTLYSSQNPQRPPFAAHGYSNPEFEALAEKQLVTLDDNQRKEILAQMQRIVADDVPILPLFYPSPLLVYRNTIFDHASSSEVGRVLSKAFYLTGGNRDA